MEADVYVRKVSDCRTLLEATRARRAGLEAYVPDSLEMFRVELRYGEAGQTVYAVEAFTVPSGVGWRLACRGGKDTRALRVRARLGFIRTREECQLVRWAVDLRDGGYFTDGQYPGVGTAACPRCGCVFKAGTAHEHVVRDGVIVPHDYRLHRAQRALGILPGWQPCTGDVPSLEDGERAG